MTKRTQAVSSNKTFVSNGEFKHTNDRLYITLYTYDRQNTYYFRRLIDILTELYNDRLIKQLKKRLILIKTLGLEYLSKIDVNKHMLIEKVNNLKKQSKRVDVKYISFYKENLKKLYINLVSTALPRVKVYLYYKQLIHVNQSKYNYTYLQILKNTLEKIYKKKVEFNIINVKHFGLNSDILSKIITLKITKNRVKLLNYLKKSIQKTKNHAKKKNIYLKSNLKTLNLMNDPLERLLRKNIRPHINCLKEIAIQEIRYKYIGGVKLLISGRLTKRYTAARSTKKLKS
jgi:hypothetical protein